MSARFLSRDEIAQELNVTRAQVYALVRRGELRAMKIGGRGIWRIGRDDLEAYIQRAYDDTNDWIDEHPFSEDDDPPDQV